VPEDVKKNDAIALCLSGGGLRATLFHLGVVRALRAYGPDEENSALSRVTELYAVSGGSILAAHMIANWDRYTGSEDQFSQVEQEILAFTRRNMRDRILRRWVLFRPLGLLLELLSKIPLADTIIRRRPGLFSRTYWLRKEYDGLLKSVTMCDLENARAALKRPLGHILTTSFTSGELCSFSGSTFAIELPDDKVESTPSGHLRMSLAVAASSAFPPMFPPLELNDDVLANPILPDRFNRIFLSDGGVYDNLGVEKFRKNAARDKDHPYTLVISDAGGSFRAGAEKRFGGIFSRNVRASDILMHRLGDGAKAAVEKMMDVDDIPIRISTTVNDGTLDPAVQQRLRLVRTDLDRFSPAEAKMLVDHGARVTHQAMRDHHWPAPRSAPADAQACDEVEAADAIAGKAANRSYRSLILDVRDWTLFPLLLIILGVVGGLGYYVYANQQARAAEAFLQDSIRRADKVNKDKLVARSAAQERRLEQASAALEHRDYDELKRILSNGLNSAGSQYQADQAQAQKADLAVSQQTQAPPSTAPDPGVPIASQPHPQKVFIQFAGILTRESITDFNAALRAQGWATQSTSGERTPKAAGFNEVRFAAPNEAVARQLADAINAAGIVDKPVGLRPVTAVGVNNLEVWISR